MVGSGGVLSYAPRRGQAAMIMIDALQPEGITELMLDNQFLLPHLGVIMDVDEDAFEQILEKESIVPLGTVIAPVGPRLPQGATIARVEIEDEIYLISSGDIQVVKIPPQKSVTVNVTPEKDFNIGNGPGVSLVTQAAGGHVGIILDGRGRPLHIPESEPERQASSRRWLTALDVYPLSVKGLSGAGSNPEVK